MTSEEALGILYSKADTTNECWECRQIIEKDLEVLEILKKQITAFEYKKIDDFEDFTRSYYLKITTEGLDLTKFNKIKEWLDNERK